MGVPSGMLRHVSHSATVGNAAVGVLVAIVTLFGGGVVSVQRTVSCRGVEFTRVVGLLLVLLLLLLRKWW